MLRQLQQGGLAGAAAWVDQLLMPHQQTKHPAVDLRGRRGVERGRQRGMLRQQSLPWWLLKPHSDLQRHALHAGTQPCRLLMVQVAVP